MKQIAKYTKIWGLFLFLISFYSLYANPKLTVKQNKPRIVVTCDPELDDLNSLIRFLLYSTDFQVEGLIYASSQFHWKGDGKGTKWFVPGREYTRHGLNIGPMESWRWSKDERFIHDAVEAYENVYHNLKVHNSDYPTPEYLKSKIRYGNIEFDGDISKDSEGSDLIKTLMLDDVPGPLFVTAWGGQSTIARALKSIQEQYENTDEWKSIQKKVSEKVIILPSGDQDDTYAKYIKPNWPNIGYWQFGGGVALAYNAQGNATKENAFYYAPAWMEKNISRKGPLGSLYRVWGDGKQMVKGDIFDYFGLSGYSEEELKKMGYIVWTPIRIRGSFIAEGDTHTFLNLLDNGLRAYEDPSYGGWGGRKRDMSNDSTLPMGAFTRRDSVLPDFFPALQNGLAARFNWSVTSSYKEANHEPEIDAPCRISAVPGEKIQLKANVSDPDGDKISMKWWHFKVGSYKGDILINNPISDLISFEIPSNAEKGQTIHLILEVRDDGSPQLTRYHRTIINIQ